MQLSDFDDSPNLVSLFLDRADRLGQEPMLWARHDKQWQAISWAEAARQVCLIAENLRAKGLNAGDRVLLVSENRPEWCLADLGIMAAGCVTVPAYTTNTERDHLHVLNNSGARAVIASSAKLAKPLIAALAQNDATELLFTMEPIPHAQEGNFSWHQWSELLEGDAEAARKAVDERIAGIGRNDLACIIYTSGTGGAPRGVK